MAKRVDAATRMRSNGGKARAAKHTAEQIATWGMNGGLARAANMTAADRKAAAKKAAEARWRPNLGQIRQRRAIDRSKKKGII
jgi:hypothetical protein